MPNCKMFSDSSKTEHTFLPRNNESEAIAMKETLYTQLLQYIENLDITQLDESQLHVAIGFIKTLFGFHD